MEVYKSSYYDKFRCIANQCPDSCCKEWDVQIDSDSASFYRSLPGTLGERLRQVLVEDTNGNNFMTIEDGRCPMWRHDGLCRIQAELGHEALCQTCRDFPRLTHDYGDFIELGLELSCPEAARLILTSPDTPLIREATPGGEKPEYDKDAMKILLETREKALSILSDVTYCVPESLALLLFYGYQAQAQLDHGEIFDFNPNVILCQAREMAQDADISTLLQFFLKLEILTQEWKARLETPATPSTWTEIFRNMARYGVERYWLQAVSDCDLIGRVKLIVISCLVVRALGGNMIATAQLYSKEIENDADNIDSILDGAYVSPALTDDKLLGWLLL